MPRGRGPRKVNREKRRRVQRNVKRRASQRRDRIRDEARARSGGGGGGGANVATGGSSTGRESGILATQTKDKKTSLEQSIGSLDRRINNAINAGDLDLAKDLRSRQNKFVKNLGYLNAHKAMISNAPLSQRDRIRTQIRNNPNLLNQKGLSVFNETIDRDFLDPTRKLINENPEAYGAMYPVANQLRQGLPGSRFLKGIAGVDDKQQQYTNPKMPGERYALDKDFGKGAGATGPEFMDDAIIADDFDKSLDVAPDAVPLPDTNVTVRQKPQPDVSDRTLLETLFDANRDEPGIQIFNPNPTPGEDRSLNLAPNLFKNIGSAFDADPNTPGIQIFNPNPGQRVVEKAPSGPMNLVDENPFRSGTQISGDNFANQVANNTTIMKENIANSNLSADQKQVLLNQIDTQMQENVSGLDMLTSDAPVSLPGAVNQQLNNANPESEAAALEILNSLSNNQNRGFNISGLFDANPNVPGVQIFNTNPNRTAVNNQGGGFSLADLFDANPDEAGFQLFNLNPNR